MVITTTEEKCIMWTLNWFPASASADISWSLSRTRPDESEEANWGGGGAVRKATARRECTSEQSPGGRGKREVAEGWSSR